MTYMSYARQLTQLYHELANKFPTGLSLPLSMIRELLKDPHSIMYGELWRWRNFLEKYDEQKAVLALSPGPEHRRREALRRFVYDYFVGDRNDPTATHARMYQHPEGGYKQALKDWKRARADVEEMFEYLLSLVPRYVTMDGKTRDLRHVLRRPAAVREATDILDLIELTRAGELWEREDRLLRHYARQTLFLTQMNLEFGDQGVAPGILKDEAEHLRAFIERNLFEGQAGERVYIVAELDPQDSYRCTSWTVVEDASSVPEATETRAVFPMQRYFLRVRKGARRVPLFFLIRHKAHPLLKAFTKRIRFLQLMGLGDAIAMKFVVEPEYLDEVVMEVRRVLVRCPGQVCDQGSNIGHRNGHSLDQENRFTTPDYEAMKYLFKLWDRLVEGQFQPFKPYLNSLCMHSRVNHDWYKLMQIVGEIFHFLFPVHLVGIEWPIEFDKVTGVPVDNRELWDQLIGYLLKKVKAE